MAEDQRTFARRITLGVMGVPVVIGTGILAWVRARVRRITTVVLWPLQAQTRHKLPTRSCPAHLMPKSGPTFKHHQHEPTSPVSHSLFAGLRSIVALFFEIT